MAKRVQVVRFFNGARDEAKAIGNAQTLEGVKRLLKKAPTDAGWGIEVRGDVEGLKALGASETDVGWILVLDRYTQEAVGCAVG